MEDWLFFTGPSIADIDGAVGGLPEAIVSSGGYFVHAFNAAGLEPAGWPKNTGHWVTMTPSTGDLDGDGDLEVVVATRMGDLHVWSTPGDACGNAQWRKARADEWNTGMPGIDTRRPNAVLNLAASGKNLTWTAPGDDGACGTAPHTTSATRRLQSTKPSGTLTTRSPPPRRNRQARAETFDPKLIGRYYIAIRTIDEAGNMSAVSNTIHVCLLPAPVPNDPDCDGFSTTIEELRRYRPRAFTATSRPCE